MSPPVSSMNLRASSSASRLDSSRVSGGPNRLAWICAEADSKNPLTPSTVSRRSVLRVFLPLRK